MSSGQTTHETKRSKDYRKKYKKSKHLISAMKREQEADRKEMDSLMDTIATYKSYMEGIRGVVERGPKKLSQKELLLDVQTDLVSSDDEEIEIGVEEKKDSGLTDDERGGGKC
eukprot:jgi/Bigna1/144390/aug1.87_g19098